MSRWIIGTALAIAALGATDKNAVRVRRAKESISRCTFVRCVDFRN